MINKYAEILDKIMADEIFAITDRDGNIVYGEVDDYCVLQEPIITQGELQGFILCAQYQNYELLRAFIVGLIAGGLLS